MYTHKTLRHNQWKEMDGIVRIYKKKGETVTTWVNRCQTVTTDRTQQTHTFLPFLMWKHMSRSQFTPLFDSSKIPSANASTKPGTSRNNSIFVANQIAVRPDVFSSLRGWRQDIKNQHNKSCSYFSCWFNPLQISLRDFAVRIKEPPPKKE